jgi:hypothetical protein
MPKLLAAVDEQAKIIWVEYPNGLIIKYDLHMYSAALENSKYFEDATLEEIGDGIHIPDIILREEG